MITWKIESEVLRKYFQVIVFKVSLMIGVFEQPLKEIATVSVEMFLFI